MGRKKDIVQPRQIKYYEYRIVVLNIISFTLPPTPKGLPAEHSTRREANA